MLSKLILPYRSGRPEPRDVVAADCRPGHAAGAVGQHGDETGATVMQVPPGRRGPTRLRRWHDQGDFEMTTKQIACSRRRHNAASAMCSRSAEERVSLEDGRPLSHVFRPRFGFPGGFVACASAAMAVEIQPDSEWHRIAKSKEGGGYGTMGAATWASRS